MSNEKQIPEWMKEGFDIVQSLAEWSRKYPRGRIYSMSQMSMDEELVALENRAKELTDKKEWAIREFSLSGMKEAIEFAKFLDDIKINADKYFNLPRTATTEELYKEFKKRSGESCSESIDGQKVYDVEEVYGEFTNDEGEDLYDFVEYLKKEYKLIKSTTQNIKE